MSFQQAERLKDVQQSKTRIMFNKCAQLRAAGEKVIALTLGEPDFDTPEYVKESCKRALDEGLTKYADNVGIAPLREAICQKLREENGLEYSPEEIGVTSGVAQGMFAAIVSFLNPGDEILVPDPVYLTYNEIPKVAGAVVKNYRLLEENNFQVDIEEIKSLITEKTKMIVIVSPSNPTGGILSEKNLEDISRIAIENDLLVLSDEIYERLTYSESNRCVSIASFPNMKERTIILNGLSKSMAMTGWRIGYMAAPAELIEPMNRLAFYMTAGATSFAQYAAVDAFRGGSKYVEEMRLEFKRRRDYLAAEVNKLKHFSCAVPEGAFYVFMNIKKTGMTSQEFCEFALEKTRLAVIPGDAFGSCGEGFVRMSYAASMEVLSEAVECLKILDNCFDNK